MKLMSKTAEDRYQSAVGLKADLEYCLANLTGLEDSSGFIPGQHDVSGRFQIPETLYGRAQETNTLLQAFERVSEGNTEMVLVTGYAGVGKSSLVHEAHTPITATRGYFISGKFDQFQRNIPYSALIQAFQAFVTLLLTEEEDVLAAWKAQILNAVGKIGKVLTNVFPNLERVIGKQPEIPELGPAEAQNRFNLAFKNFINVISRKDHPLVLFLDDLQWADSASLNLLNSLMSDRDIRYFLPIGAYRDNEVSASHPLMLTIDDLQQAHVAIETITVSNLSVQHVTDLIADTLRHPEGERELAELVYDKTRGNAFFVKQFLHTLYNEDILLFDVENQRWHWKRERIQHLSITENVVDLMAAKVQKLLMETQTLLTLAACIGSRFELETLAVIAERSLQDTAHALHVALVEGLILDADSSISEARLSGPETDISGIRQPVSNIRFAHDRIQEAAYSLIPEEEKAAVHLRIGNILRDKIPRDQQDERIFDIVNQLNWGRTLIESPDDMLRLAELNLRAGKKAKASTAYQPALRYFTMGTEILPEGSWDSHHTLTFALYLKRCECEYLTTHFDEAEALLTHMLSHTASSLEQAEIYTIGIVQYTMLSRDEEALEMGRKALKLFDIDLPEHGVQTAAQKEVEDVRFNLGDRNIADLVDLPMMTDPEKQQAVKLLIKLVPPSYVKLKNLALFTFITAKAINITIKFGNTPEMPFGYGIYGIILRTLFGEYDMADEFGKLGIQLSEKLNDATQKCRVVYIAAGYLNHWRMPVESGVPLARQSFRYALESGELQMAGYTFNPLFRALTIQGEELGMFHQQVERAQQFANKTKNIFVHDLCTLWRQFIRNLQGRTQNTRTFNDHAFVEQQFLDGVGRVSSTGGNFCTLK
ncbi:MAG: AAA family ATPase [bacterium]|nr:AAA family ATPase [bacterium]